MKQVHRSLFLFISILISASNVPLECDDPKCSGNGIKIDLDEKFICSCNGGWVGACCSIPTCEGNNPCEHDSECIIENSAHVCVCDNQKYAGEHCQYECPQRCIEGFCVPFKKGRGFCLSQLRINEPKRGSRCKVNPCLNGDCYRRGEIEGCICHRGWIGENCSQPTCATYDKCQNEGKCQLDDDGFRCECPEGYGGKYCQHKCDLECINGDCEIRVVKMENDEEDLIYSNCNCKFGFSGKYCETEEIGPRDIMISTATIIVAVTISVLIVLVMIFCISGYKRQTFAYETLE